MREIVLAMLAVVMLVFFGRGSKTKQHFDPRRLSA